MFVNFVLTDKVLLKTLRWKGLLLQRYYHLMRHTKSSLCQEYEVDDFCIQFISTMSSSLKVRKRGSLCRFSRNLAEVASFQHFLFLLCTVFVSYLDFDLLDVIVAVCQNMDLEDILISYLKQVNAYKTETSLLLFAQSEGLPEVNPPKIITKIVRKQKLTPASSLKDLERVRNCTESIEDWPLEHFSLLVAKVIWGSNCDCFSNLRRQSISKLRQQSSGNMYKFNFIASTRVQ